jgi:hypothetical protein
MEGLQNDPQNGVIDEDAPRMNFFERLVGIYSSPQATFEDINRKGSWLGIFLIMAVLASTMAFLPQYRMDHETYMRKALQMNPMTRKMPEEQVKAIVERPQGSFQRFSGMIFAPLGVLVAYLVCAGALLLVLVLLGGGLTFKKSLAVTIWGMAPPGFVNTILAIIFMMIKDPDTLDIDPSKNVASNLSMLVSQADHPVLSSLLGSIDVFSFWTIFLLATGFSVASEGRLTRGKAATGVIILWALYIGVKVGMSAVFS